MGQHAHRLGLVPQGQPNHRPHRVGARDRHFRHHPPILDLGHDRERPHLALAGGHADRVPGPSLGLLVDRDGSGHLGHHRHRLALPARQSHVQLHAAGCREHDVTRPLGQLDRLSHRLAREYRDVPNPLHAHHHVPQGVAGVVVLLDHLAGLGVVAVPLDFTDRLDHPRVEEQAICLDHRTGCGDSVLDRLICQRDLHAVGPHRADEVRRRGVADDLGNGHIEGVGDLDQLAHGGEPHPLGHARPVPLGDEEHPPACVLERQQRRKCRRVPVVDADPGPFPVPAPTHLDDVLGTVPAAVDQPVRGDPLPQHVPKVHHAGVVLEVLDVLGGQVGVVETGGRDEVRAGPRRLARRDPEPLGQEVRRRAGVARRVDLERQPVDLVADTPDQRVPKLLVGVVGGFVEPDAGELAGAELGQFVDGLIVNLAAAEDFDAAILLPVPVRPFGQDRGRGRRARQQRAERGGLEVRQAVAAQQFDRAGHLGPICGLGAEGDGLGRAVGTRIQHLAVSAEDERLLLGQQLDGGVQHTATPASLVP